MVLEQLDRRLAEPGQPVGQFRGDVTPEEVARRLGDLDGTGRYSDPVTVNIRVNSPASAVNDNYVLNEDVPLSVPAGGTWMSGVA